MERKPQAKHRGEVRMRGISFLACITLLGLAGCSRPSEVERQNRRLLDALLTAVSTSGGGAVCVAPGASPAGSSQEEGGGSCAGVGGPDTLWQGLRPRRSVQSGVQPLTVEQARFGA